MRFSSLGIPFFLLVLLLPLRVATWELLVDTADCIWVNDFMECRSKRSQDGLVTREAAE